MLERAPEEGVPPLSKGHLAGKHFSCGDLMNVGKCVLKAIWECKKLLLNKNRLKEIMIEAQSAVK